MIALGRTITLVPVLLGMAACQMTRLPDGSLTFRKGVGGSGVYSSPETQHMRTPYSIIPGWHFTTEKDARSLAALLVQAYDTNGGMQGVAGDVQRCYAFADADLNRNFSMPSEYRFCVLNDAVAYRVDNTRVRTYGYPRTPYFDPAQASNRWRRNINNAGQGRQSELDAFMLSGASLTAKYLPLRLFGLRQ